jgi:hypothetical protein
VGKTDGEVITSTNRDHSQGYLSRIGNLGAGEGCLDIVLFGFQWGYICQYCYCNMGEGFAFV